MADDASYLEPGEKLPGNGTVYRMVHQKLYDAELDEPKWEAFIPNKADDFQLSVDYKEYTEAEASLARFALTHKTKPINGEYVFKKHQDYKVYYMLNEFLFDDRDIEDITYAPRIENEVGKPKNLAHSLVHFFKFSPGDYKRHAIGVNIYLHAKNNYVHVKEDIIEKYIEELKIS